MSFLAFVLILGSAVFHASWNMLAKKSHMSIGYYACICSFGLLAWWHVALWTPIPLSQLNPHFFLIMAGVLLSEILYATGLTMAYSRLNMVTAYPLMRGLPILLTALITSCTGLGAPLTLTAGIGFLIVFTGAMLMPLSRLSDFKLSNYWNWSMIFVLMAALGTTGYTICDSMAQQEIRLIAGKTPKPLISVTYYSMRAMMLSPTIWILAFSTSCGRASLKRLWRKRDWTPLLAGFCGSLTYVTVLFAMNFVTNVSYVQVFRQMGLPIGMLAGILFLKEKSTPTKWVGVTLIMLGLALSVLKF